MAATTANYLKRSCDYVFFDLFEFSSLIKFLSKLTTRKLGCFLVCVLLCILISVSCLTYILAWIT